jgi:hypothetical protein
MTCSSQICGCVERVLFPPDVDVGVRACCLHSLPHEHCWEQFQLCCAVFWMTLKLVATEGLGRDSAIATCRLSSGEVALTDNGWKTALLASEKGKRCDLCHRAASEDITLRKCTKCAEYWYCGPQCTSSMSSCVYRILKDCRSERSVEA